MVLAADCLKKYGMPGNAKTEGRFMRVWLVPDEVWQKLPALPRKVYCNNDLAGPLERALRNVIGRGLAGELKTWDGCYQVRNKRGQASASLHSWGVAVDVNAAWNVFGKAPTVSKQFVKCFTEAGFDWGGVWSKPDGMHFQLAVLPGSVAVQMNVSG